uniref:Uncharacterized protein n=1 Tax=Oryza meridionalis TaxID=40149 RepID=A0A0E0C6G5_9ORYZ
MAASPGIAGDRLIHAPPPVTSHAAAAWEIGFPRSPLEAARNGLHPAMTVQFHSLTAAAQGGCNPHSPPIMSLFCTSKISEYIDKGVL